MARSVTSMDPTTIRRSSEGASATGKVRAALRGMAEVRGPHEAAEPILAPNARAAVFEWLAELRAEAELKAVGLRPRATALLHGPPGCGKTTLAHHLAARLGIPMVLVGSEAINSSAYFGEAERGVAKLFDALAGCDTPCVVFMDEMEGWGGKRDQNTRGGADNARTSVLGVILRRIEEFRGVLMGATNRPQDIDPALWRRFGMQIAIDLPGDEERFAILRRYLHPFTLPEDAIDVMVDITVGASPALLEGIALGVKRALVLGPRLGRDIASARAVFGPIVAALHPPPEMQPPPLWGDRTAMDALDDLPWPPERPG